MQQETPGNNTTRMNVSKPIDAGWASETPPPVEPSPTNQEPYSQPQEFLGFALGWFFIVMSPLGGLFLLYLGLHIYPTRIRLYLLFYGAPGWGMTVISMIVDNLLTILQGVLCFVSANGLVGKKPYGYYLTQAGFIIAFIWIFKRYFLFEDEESQTGVLIDCLSILINSLWFLYFEKRKHMFVPEPGNRHYT